MPYTYFPGCCMEGFGRHCEESMLAVFGALGLELRKMPDWNCCGATTYISVDEYQAIACAARNLALAEKAGLELVAPCSACFMILKKARDYLARYEDLRAKVLPALAQLNLRYEGKCRVFHPLEILWRDVGPQKLRKYVKRPLDGWNVATYYGCLLTRPYPLESGATLADFDELLVSLGVRLVSFPLQEHCCGGSLTGTIEEVGHRLVYILLNQAKRSGADVMVTICPLCQLNLEAHQGKLKRRYKEDIHLPIPYFTQLVGLAMGIPARDLGLERLLVPLHKEITHVGRAPREPAAAWPKEGSRYEVRGSRMV